jgi:hypothetical protein
VKRIEAAKSEKLKPVKLYRDDLEDLITLFGETCEIVRLSDEEFEYDSLSEIEGRKGPGGKLSYLEISGRKPYVSLSLGGRKLNWFYRDENNRVYAEAEDRGELLAMRLSSYLSQRQRFLPKVFNWSFGAIAIILQMLWLALSIGYQKQHPEFYKDHPSAIFLDICYFMLVIYVIALPLIIHRGMSWISLAPKHTHKSFLSEHGYDLFKGTFFIAIGIVLKWLFDRFTK